MQKHLKKRLEAIWPMLGEIQAVLAGVTEAHTTYCDERSEAWHESDAGVQSEMDSGELDDAQSNMEEVVACIDRIIHIDA